MEQMEEQAPACKDKMKWFALLPGGKIQALGLRDDYGSADAAAPEAALMVVEEPFLADLQVEMQKLDFTTALRMLLRIDPRQLHWMVQAARRGLGDNSIVERLLREEGADRADLEEVQRHMCRLTIEMDSRMQPQKDA